MTTKAQLARDLGHAEAARDQLGAELEAHRSLKRTTDVAKTAWFPFNIATVQQEHDARVAILAVALMLKDRADAMDVSQGTHVQQVQDEYGRVQRYLTILGDINEEERTDATALWDLTTE